MRLMRVRYIVAVQVAALVGMAYLVVVSVIVIDGVASSAHCTYVGFVGVYQKQVPGLFSASYGELLAVSCTALGIVLVASGALVILRMIRSGLYVTEDVIVVYETASKGINLVPRRLVVNRSEVRDIDIVWRPWRGRRWIPGMWTGRVVVRLIDGQQVSGAGLTFWLPLSVSGRKRVDMRVALVCSGAV